MEFQLTTAYRKLAERGGFEPPVGCYTYNALAKRRYRPLSHLSGSGATEATNRKKKCKAFLPLFSPPFSLLSVTIKPDTHPHQLDFENNPLCTDAFICPHILSAISKSCFPSSSIFPNSVTMQTIGERLEEARKRKGISIREAAEATKIRSDYLHKFESNQFDIKLPDIYLRGFLRNYANFLKLPGDRIVADFQALGFGEVRSAKALNREVYGRMDISASNAKASGDEAPSSNTAPGFPRQRQMRPRNNRRANLLRDPPQLCRSRLGLLLSAPALPDSILTGDCS